MPINFESTFTQPILAELDAGRVKNASDWARLITRSYVRTIKTGAPTGIPFTLPAPALAGSPYPIGNTFFNTIDAKSRLMENIIKAYFLTEEISVQRSGIRGLIQTIRQLVLKGRVLKSQIKSTTQQILIIRRELANLPATINELLQNLKESLAQRIKELDQLINAIDNFKLQSNDPNINQIFRDELLLINEIRNLHFSFNLQTIQKITTYLTGVDTKVTQLRNATSSTDTFKVYILQRVVLVVKDLYELINTAVYPTEYITFYQRLATNSRRANIIYQKLLRIEYFNKKLEPQLTKLQEKLKEKKNKLTSQVETKISQLKEDLKKRSEELAKRKGDGKSRLYQNAKATLSDYNKRYKKQIAETQKEVRRYIKIGNQLTKIATKSIVITLGVVRELQKLKDLQKNTAAQVDESRLLVADFSSKNNLSQVANLLTLLVVNSRVDAQTLINQLRLKTTVMARYYNDLVSLFNKDIPDLLALIYQKPVSTKDIKQEQEVSPISFFTFYENKFKPELNRVDSIVKEKVSNIKKAAEEKIDTSKKDLEEFAVNLIPIKSDVGDRKTKKLNTEEKARLIKDKKNKLNQIKQYLTFGTQLTQGASVLLNNINNGQYSYSKNEQAINKIADGYFNFKLSQSEQNSTNILNKKQKFKERTQDLSIIEGLILGVNALVDRIKSNPNFKNEWTANILQNIKNETQITVFQTLGQVLEGTIKKPKDLIEVSNRLTYSVIQDVNIIRNIVNLERKYTQKALQTITILGNSNTKAGNYFKELSTKLSGEKSLILLLLNEITIKQATVTDYINGFIADAKKEVRDIINRKRDKILEDNKKSLDTLREKTFNTKAAAMSLTFGLATRVLWSGATWIGPTGTVFVVNSIGPFKPIKAQVSNGASGLIRELAKSLESQLRILTGTYSNPGAGITPIPFIGYS